MNSGCLHDLQSLNLVICIIEVQVVGSNPKMSEAVYLR